MAVLKWTACVFLLSLAVHCQEPLDDCDHTYIEQPVPVLSCNPYTSGFRLGCDMLALLEPEDALSVEWRRIIDVSEEILLGALTEESVGIVIFNGQRYTRRRSILTIAANDVGPSSYWCQVRVNGDLLQRSNILVLSTVETYSGADACSTNLRQSTDMLQCADLLPGLTTVNLQPTPFPPLVTPTLNLQPDPGADIDTGHFKLLYIYIFVPVAVVLATVLLAATVVTVVVRRRRRRQESKKAKRMTKLEVTLQGKEGGGDPNHAHAPPVYYDFKPSLQKTESVSNENSDSPTLKRDYQSLQVTSMDYTSLYMMPGMQKKTTPIVVQGEKEYNIVDPKKMDPPSIYTSPIKRRMN